MDGCCIMKSPITESDKSGDPITIIALSRESGKTRLTVYTRVPIETYMEDLDKNQFQSNQPHDVTDYTEAKIAAENRANYDNDNVVYIMNICE